MGIFIIFHWGGSQFILLMWHGAAHCALHSRILSFSQRLCHLRSSISVVNSTLFFCRTAKSMLTGVKNTLIQILFEKTQLIAVYSCVLTAR